MFRNTGVNFFEHADSGELHIYIIKKCVGTLVTDTTCFLGGETWREKSQHMHLTIYYA
jgi:hypothetical protein